MLVHKNKWFVNISIKALLFLSPSLSLYPCLSVTVTVSVFPSLRCSLQLTPPLSLPLPLYSMFDSSRPLSCERNICQIQPNIQSKHGKGLEHQDISASYHKLECVMLRTRHEHENQNPSMYKGSRLTGSKVSCPCLKSSTTVILKIKG